jgi:hypothetical protein
MNLNISDLANIFFIKLRYIIKTAFIIFTLYITFSDNLFRKQVGHFNRKQNYIIYIFLFIGTVVVVE